MFGFGLVRRACQRFADVINAWADDLEASRLALRRELNLLDSHEEREVIDHQPAPEEEEEQPRATNGRRKAVKG